MARGGKRDGSGRKAGIPNKATGEAKELARQWGPKAIKRAAQLAGLLPGEKGKAESEAAQMAAVNTILDRAYGKAAQPVGGGDGTEPLKHLFGWMNAE